MKKKIICPLTCPMRNEYGFCESARCRVKRVRECPHDKLHAAAQTKRAPPGSGEENEKL
nr:hypothetical protein [uncultured Agathobaculum sp.]